MTATMSGKQASAEETAAAQGGEEGEGEEKKGGLKKKLIIFLVVALVGFGAYSKVIKPKFFPPHYKPGQTVPAGKILSLGQNTINLSDGHLLQVSVALQLTEPAAMAKLTDEEPEFENAEIDVFGALTMPDLLDPAGREAAQASLLTALQKIAGTSEGAQQISAVYFTSFVTQ
jgi:flagellar protein FliL